MAKYSEAQKNATLRYRRKNYKTVSIDFKFSDYEKIKACADAAGLPLSAFIRDTLKARIYSV